MNFFGSLFNTKKMNADPMSRGGMTSKSAREPPRADKITRGNVTMIGQGHFDVLGLVSIAVPGPWWWHRELARSTVAERGLRTPHEIAICFA
jgi:hypothetical protein